MVSRQFWLQKKHKEIWSGAGGGCEETTLYLEYSVGHTDTTSDKSHQTTLKIVHFITSFKTYSLLF